MFWRKVKNDAMGGIAQKRLAGRHGLENPALAFDSEVAFKTDLIGY